MNPARPHRKFLGLLILLAVNVRAETVSFDRAFSEMVKQNVNVRIQQTKLAASESELWAARGGFTPQLSLQAQQQNSNNNQLKRAEGNSGYVAAQVYKANVEWNIFRSGADVSLLNAAVMNRSMQLSELDESYLQAENKAAQALLDLMAKGQTVNIYKRSADSVRHFLEIAQARFAKSLLSREETDKIALDSANAEALRADAEIQYNNARATVEALLGHARVSNEWPWTKKFEHDQVKKWLDFKTNLQDLERRPDLRAARASLEFEDLRRQSARRLMLPKVDLTYSVGETHYSRQTVSSWETAAILTIPLWSGLRDYSNYRVRAEAKVAAELRLRQLEKDIHSTIEAAQSNFRLSLEQYQVRTKNLVMAKRILDQEDARFKMGRANANELNIDLGRVTEAEILAIRGAQHAHMAYLELLHVFGERVR